MPIHFKEDMDHPGLKYLKHAKELFEKWQQSGNIGLTKETFLACKQTMDAIPKLAFHIIKNHRFSYILSGKLMSDLLEGQFVWYRQKSWSEKTFFVINTTAPT